MTLVLESRSDFQSALKIADEARKTEKAKGRLLQSAAVEALRLCVENWLEILDLAARLEKALEEDPEAAVNVYHLTHP